MESIHRCTRRYDIAQEPPEKETHFDLLRTTGKRNTFYVMLSGRVSINMGENIFRSYTGTTIENTDFLVA